MRWGWHCNAVWPVGVLFERTSRKSDPNETHSQRGKRHWGNKSFKLGQHMEMVAIFHMFLRGLDPLPQ